MVLIFCARNDEEEGFAYDISNFEPFLEKRRCRLHWQVRGSLGEEIMSKMRQVFLSML